MAFIPETVGDLWKFLWTYHNDKPIRIRLDEETMADTRFVVIEQDGKVILVPTRDLKDEA